MYVQHSNLKNVDFLQSLLYLNPWWPTGPGLLLNSEDKLYTNLSYFFVNCKKKSRFCGVIDAKHRKGIVFSIVCLSCLAFAGTMDICSKEHWLFIFTMC